MIRRRRPSARPSRNPRWTTRTSSKASSTSTRYRRPTSPWISTSRWSMGCGRSPTRQARCSRTPWGVSSSPARSAISKSSGADSREGKDGQQIHTDVRFSIGIKGDPGPAVQLIREALWWVDAPGDTDLDGFPLALTREPAIAAGRFLQLAAPEVARWRLGGEDGHRIDRVPFTPAQRDGIRRILAEAQAAEAANGWVSVATRDGGRMAVSIKYLDDAPDYDTLNILVDALTPEISGLVYRLMLECDLMSCRWPSPRARKSPGRSTVAGRRSRWSRPRRRCTGCWPAALITGGVGHHIAPRDDRPGAAPQTRALNRAIPPASQSMWGRVSRRSKENGVEAPDSISVRHRQRASVRRHRSRFIRGCFGRSDEWHLDFAQAFKYLTFDLFPGSRAGGCSFSAFVSSCVAQIGRGDPRPGAWR